MAEYKFIKCELIDGVGVVTLNRPEVLNALSHDLIREFSSALDQLPQRGARALVITGAGRGFSAGGDLARARPSAAQGMAADMAVAIGEVWNPFVEKLAAAPMPVITAINGPVAGAGCGIALAGDFIIMAKSAYMTLSFIKVGLVADAGATWLLTKILGRQRATRMLMLSERISAEQADQWGMLYKVVEDGAALDAAMELARQLAAGPTKAYALMRASIRDALDGSLTESLAAELKHQVAAGQSADHLEGRTAFLEKRAPRYVGA